MWRTLMAINLLLCITACVGQPPPPPPPVSGPARMNLMSWIPVHTGDKVPPGVNNLGPESAGNPNLLVVFCRGAMTEPDGFVSKHPGASYSRNGEIQGCFWHYGNTGGFSQDFEVLAGPLDFVRAGEPGGLIGGSELGGTRPFGVCQFNDGNHVYVGKDFYAGCWYFNQFANALNPQGKRSMGDQYSNVKSQ